MTYIKILGCFSASMTTNKFQSSQVLFHNNKSYLIDSGEGVQMLLSKYDIKLSSIDYIFISHLHGDHFFGLAGLLTTMNRRGRTKNLTIFCPKGLKEIITLTLKKGKSWTKFDLIFQEYSQSSETLLSNEELSVMSFPINHRIPCKGFRFNIKSSDNHISYAYCSDTMYDEKILKFIDEVDLLYHEATFLEKHKDLALKTKHSTTKDAAKIAAKAKVKKLLIGHFSTRYKDLNQFLLESCSIFDNTVLAEQGKKYIL